MKPCPNCREGSLQEQVIDAWEKRSGRWVLIENVPALICDECGFEAFNQTTAEALEAFTSESGSARPIGSRDFAVYDFAMPHPKAKSAQTSSTRTDLAV